MALVKQLTTAFKQISLVKPTHITKPILVPTIQQRCYRKQGPPKDLQPLDGGEAIPIGLRRSSREFQAQSTFKPETAPYRYGYETKYYTGGLLPRHKKLKDVRLPEKPYNSMDAYRWSRKKALKGQNDYIDILGDGNIEPYELMEGPEWLRGFRGNELQRIVRQIEFAGTYLRDMKPMELLLLNKRLFFLYKKMNKRKPERISTKLPEKFADILPARYKSRFERYYRLHQ